MSVYKAWLPNASGYLSFSHVGCRDHPKIRSESVLPLDSSANAKRRSVFQMRELSERPPISLLMSKAESTFHASTRGVTSKHAFLMQGDVCIEHATKRLTGIVISVPATYRRKLVSLHEDYSIKESNIPLKDWISTIDSSVSDYLLALEFTLDADGILSLTPLKWPSSSEAAFDQWIFEHYAFLRDIFHKHKFHSPRDDCKLEVYLECEGAAWVSDVARALHRSVISSFRNSQPGSHSLALGKLAYLQAFRRVVDARGLSRCFPAIDLQSLSSAIEAARLNSESENAHQLSRSTFLLSLVALFFTVAFASLAISQIPCIEGLSYDKDKCLSTKFVIPSNYNSYLAFSIEFIDQILFVSIIIFVLSLVRTVWPDWRLYVQEKIVNGLPFFSSLLVRYGWQILLVVIGVFVVIVWGAGVTLFSHFGPR